MTRSKQQQLQFQFQFRFRCQFRFQLQLLLMLLTLLQLLPAFAALPQEEFLLEIPAAEQAPSSPAFTDPSDLSAGLNLLPVSNLIAAAANAVPPAPVQFVRIAMNSGL